MAQSWLMAPVESGGGEMWRNRRVRAETDLTNVVIISGPGVTFSTVTAESLTHAAHKIAHICLEKHGKIYV